MTQKTKQGRYLARVVTIRTTINPESEPELAKKWQALLDQHGGQTAAIKYMIHQQKPQ